MPKIARMMTTKERPLVVVLAYDGLCTFEFGVAVEIFGLPRPELGENWYRFAVAAIEHGELKATGGIRVMADGGLELLAVADTIIVPGWRDPAAPVPENVCDALRAAHARGCRLLSICSGVFVLAAAGVLRGRQATTHWRYIDQLQQRFPDITVVDNVLYLDEGTVMTSAGSAAGLDLCLYLVRLDYGTEAANTVARRLVIQPFRDGAQPQQLTRPVARARESQTMGQLFSWLHQNITLNHSVDSLATRVGMSPRTFLRRFTACTGKTPARWLLNERLVLACDYLENSQLSIDMIAEQTGFSNAALFRHHFRHNYLLSPTQYRSIKREKNRRVNRR